MRIFTGFPDMENNKSILGIFLLYMIDKWCKIFILFLCGDIVFVEKSRLFFRKCILLSRKDYFARKTEKKQICRIILKMKSGGKRYEKRISIDTAIRCNFQI